MACPEPAKRAAQAIKRDSEDALCLKAIYNMRQATKGHAGRTCAGKRDFLSRKTPKRSHFSQKNGRI